MRLYALEVGDGKVIKRPTSSDAYQVVGDEVLTEKLDPRCWAQALAEGAKTKDEALSIYAKIRAEELAGKVTVEETKAKALEERKLAAGLPESHYQTRIVWRKRYSLVWDFLFWQILLSVSGVGLFLVILAMGTDSRWWPGLLPLVVVSACLQLSPMAFYGLGKLLVGKVRYTQALAATAVALIALGGVMGVQNLMGKKSPRWIQFVVDKTVEEQREPESVVMSGEEF
ncbi:MAG: hypothetical protein ACSHYB_02125 [Roseibacillus sp.]